MSNRSMGLALVLALLLGGCRHEGGQETGIAVLSESRSGFARAQSGMTVQLPRDMGPHPDYRVEWWYLTANLEAADGRRFGVQWTLFRVGLHPAAGPPRAPGWYNDGIWLAHAALSTPDRHLFASRRARGGTGEAGVLADPFAAWIDDWQLQLAAGQGWRLAVTTGAFHYRLRLVPVLPPALHGNRGFSAKSATGGGSMYFSYPLLRVDGEIGVSGQSVPVSGRAWFDREWSSQYLQPNQTGWDWLGLHLDDGRQLMLFRIRGERPYYTGTLISAAGTARPLDAGDFRLQPVGYRDTTRARVPVRWRVSIPSAGLDLRVESWSGEYWNSGQLLYWEGPVQVAGSVTGKGYLELTGYGD